GRFPYLPPRGLAGRGRRIRGGGTASLSGPSSYDTVEASATLFYNRITGSTIDVDRIRCACAVQAAPICAVHSAQGTGSAWPIHRGSAPVALRSTMDFPNQNSRCSTRRRPQGPGIPHGGTSERTHDSTSS